jgi:PST family polysaccharide transporter
LAWAVVAAIFVHFCIISAVACRRIGASAVDFVRAHVHGALLAVLTGLVAWAAAAPWWSIKHEGLLPIVSSGLALSLLATILMVLRPRILLGGDGAEFLAGMHSLAAKQFPYFARRA